MAKMCWKTVLITYLFIVNKLNIYGSATYSNEKLDLIQIKLESGILQGNIKQTVEGVNYYNFQGIPYALPPIGRLRFKDPVPYKKWTGILNATQFGPTCVEITLRQINFSVSGQEDCLYLNVYTSQNPHTVKRLLPVMVWIYGGSFREGTSNYYGPDYLMREDILVITFNYRLGVFGFLSTQDSNAPGNYGIKDIVLLLKWVKSNIIRFGGDPENVTVFGESAGAAIIGYLMISKQTDNLFHAAIMESGSPLCFWALHRSARKVAFDLGVSLGLTTNSSLRLVNYLRKADLQNAGHAMIGVNLINFLEVFDNGGPFGPVLEPEGENSFITRDSYKALKNGNFKKVPVLMGLNSQESKYFNSFLPLMRPASFIYDISPSSLVRTSMNVKSTKDKRNVGNKIREFYFKSKTFLGASDAEYAEYFSDDLFVRPVTKTASLLSKYVPVYFYVYDFEGNLGKNWLNFVSQDNKNVKGVAHATEIWYLWKANWTNQSFVSDNEEKVSNRLVKLWTNFAQFKNPTPTIELTFDNMLWPKIQSNELNYFYIGNDLAFGKTFKKENVDFWNNLYKNFSAGPIYTY